MAAPDFQKMLAAPDFQKMMAAPDFQKMMAAPEFHKRMKINWKRLHRDHGYIPPRVFDKNAGSCLGRC